MRSTSCLPSLSEAVVAALRRHRWGLLLGSTLAAGCGLPAEESVATDAGAPAGSAGYVAGAAGASGKGGSGGKAGAAGNQGLDLHGYFDLQFTDVKVSLPMGPGDVEPPSRTIAMRVDLPEQPSKGPWQAIVTPRWGQPSVFDASLLEGNVVLKGSASLTAPSGEGRVTDVWQSFVLEVKAKKLTGKVTATGQESFFLKELGWSGALSGAGEVSADATQPEGRAAEVQDAAADGALLPWAPMQVTFAEPLKADEALDRLALHANDAAVDVDWSKGKETPTGGISAVIGYRSSWAPLQADATLELGNGFHDPAMNSGTGFTKSYTMVTVPKASSASFEWGEGHQALWGASELVSAKDCEGSACVALGPFASASCGVLPAGTAVRLAPPDAKSELRLRLRLLRSLLGTVSPSGGPSTPAVLSIEVARPGQAPITTEVAAPVVEPSSDKEWPYASPWTTISVALPEGSGEIGVALRAGGQGATKACSVAAKGDIASSRVLIGGVSFEQH